MFRTRGLIFRRTVVTSRHTVYRICTGYICHENEPSGSKHLHAGDKVKKLFNLQAPSVLYIGHAFRYSPENVFYIFNQQIYFIIWYLLDRASLIYEVCPENSRIYRLKIFQSYLEVIQPCRLQSTPLYSVCTAASVSSMFWSIPGKLF